MSDKTHRDRDKTALSETFALAEGDGSAQGSVDGGAERDVAAWHTVADSSDSESCLVLTPDSSEGIRGLNVA